MSRNEGIDPARLARLEELFSLARAMGRAEREAWLQQEVGSDPVLLGEVQELLACDLRTADLERGVVAELQELEADSASLPERIAGFPVLRRLGAGGMGVVFEVEQQAPKRRIALKVMRAFLEPGARDRFAREIELLARLDHPNIAKIHFSGRTESGQPYLAMELVEGPTLALWARGKPSRERKLALVEKLARAMEHAHQRGVLHRDLKPSNVLLTADDEPKIVDFGVARLLDETGGTALTAERDIVGTLPYMSPERFRGARSVDTRADVYALGVIAYELLSGALPYEYEGKGVTEVIRMLETSEPIPLARREPATRGDLDAIVAHAIAPEPERRYPSASLLASDLERFGRNEPVSATATTRLYLLRKLLRRHRNFAAALALAFVALSAGLVIALVGLDRAQQAEAQAKSSEESAARARDLALEEARAADEVARRLAFILEAPAATSLPADVRFADILEVASAQLARAMEVRPEVEGRVRAALGRAFLLVGRPEQAAVHLERAVAVGAERLGTPEQRRALRLARIQMLLEIGRCAEAEDLARIFAEENDASGVTPGIELLMARDFEIRAARASGDHEHARELIDALMLRASGDMPPELRTMTLGLAHLLRGEAGVARGDLQSAAAALAALKDMTTFLEFARAPTWNTRFEQLRNAVLEGSLASAPAPGSASRWRTLFQVANSLDLLDEPERAESILREAAELLRGSEPLAAGPLMTVTSLLGSILKRQGRPEEALPWYEEAYAMAQRSQRRELMLNARVNLILALHASRRSENVLAGSEGLAEELATVGYGPQRFDVLRARGVALGRLGRFEEGERLLLETVELAKAQGRAPQEVLELVELYTAWGRPEEAARWRRAAR